MTAITPPVPGSAWPQKVDGRTHQPVRRDSFPAEAADGYYIPLPKGRAGEIMRMLRKVESLARTHRAKGQRWGLITPIELEVVEALLFKVMDWATGKLDWSYDQICEATGRARETIRKALANLRALGVVDWIRRFERTDVKGKGPQVKQITNAYRIRMPTRLASILGLKNRRPPIPDDAQIAARDRANAVASMEFQAAGKTTLEEGLARLEAAITQRESRKRSDSPGPIV